MHEAREVSLPVQNGASTKMGPLPGPKAADLTATDPVKNMSEGWGGRWDGEGGGVEREVGWRGRWGGEGGRVEREVR